MAYDDTGRVFEPGVKMKLENHINEPLEITP